MYAREALTGRDFLRLLRVRLSQSKIGPLVCRKPLTVRIDTRTLGPDVVLRSHTTDISVFGEILNGGSLEPLVAAVEGPVDRVVDLGANTGLSSRFLLNRFPGAQLVAVEPDDGNVAVLRENLDPLGRSARIIPACIGAYERPVALLGVREDGYSMHDDPAGGIDVVTMETIVDHLDGRRIDVLKVDIEGAERELFAECASWIRSVGVASVECHYPFKCSDLTAAIRRAGLEPAVVGIGSAPDFGYETVVLRLTA